MKIVDTKQYLESLYGKFLTIWIDGGALFSIDKFSSYKIINSVGTIEKNVVLFGSSSNVKFMVKSFHGFGFKVKGSQEHVWVDKMNEKEMAIIVYAVIEI